MIEESTLHQYQTNQYKGCQPPLHRIYTHNLTALMQLLNC